MTRLGALTSSTEIDPWQREKDRLAAVGVIALSAYQAAISGTAAPSQSIIGMGTYLYAGEVITNICVCVTTAAAGTAPTLIKLGLWDSAATPTCLAVTANLASDSRWTSTGWKVNALTSPYTVLASGLFYPTFLMNGTFGTTAPLFATAVANGAPGTPIGSGKRMYGSVKNSATDMAVSDTGAYAQAGSIFLFALS